MRICAVVLVALAACGGGAASSSGATTSGGSGTTPAAQGQSLADAMTLLCAAPSRVDQRDECDDATMRATCLSEEVGRGVTNTDATTLVEHLHSAVSGGEKAAEIRELATRAGITACATADAFNGT